MVKMVVTKHCLVVLVAVSLATFAKESTQAAIIPKDTSTDDSKTEYFSKPALPAKLTRILGPIPEQERNEFLRYHLNIGFQTKKVSEGAVYPRIQMELTSEEALVLYNYFMQFYKLKDEDKTKELSSWVCFPEGCIDLSDPGIFPK